MEPVLYSENDYVVTNPSANIISQQLHLYGGDRVAVGGLVR